MGQRKYKTKQEVLIRGQEAVGKTLGEIDKTGRIATGKGAIGTVVEESWFGYKPNSKPAPDFEEAGVELKVTPYRRTPRGIQAKERLVCDMLNYEEEYGKTFATSAFWTKCACMLLMSYEHKDGVPKVDFTIDKAVLFQFPDEDLEVIRNDWKILMDKIKAGHPGAAIQPYPGHEAGVLAEVQLHDADPTAVHLRGRTLREDYQRPGSVKNNQL